MILANGYGLNYFKYGKRKHPLPQGRPITSTHPRAAYWRAWKRKQYAAMKSARN